MEEKEFTTTEIYEVPSVETIYVEVEKGFNGSNEGYDDKGNSSWQ